MPNLHDVERRIKSISSTRQITNTMYMVASAKVGSSAEKLQKSLPYTHSLCKVVSSCCDSFSDSDNSLLNVHDEIKTSLIIVIVSDQGLAGGFNSNILREAQLLLTANQKCAKSTKVILCGKKAKSFFSFRNISAEMEFLGASENPDFQQAREIGKFCIDNYVSNNIDEVIVLYNKCKNNIQQIIEKSYILPLSKDKLNSIIKSSEADTSQASDSFLDEIIYEPNKVQVLNNLIPLYINTVIYNALVDSAAGEQVARRVAMQNATDNADEMLEAMNRLYNSVRQNAITTEINEIVGGAEAIS